MSNLVAYVLSGRNLGAELDITVGSYSLGSSAEAFYTLDDPTLKELHLELELTEDNELFVTPLQGKVQVNGKSISEKVALSAGALISFALNEIMLAPQGANFDELLAQAQEIKHQEYQERFNQELSEAKASLEQQLKEQYESQLHAQQEKALSADTNKEAKEATKSQAANAAEHLEATSKASSSLVYLVGMALLGLVMLAWLLYLLVFASTNNSLEYNEAQVREFLQSHHVEKMHLSRAQGYLQVSGIVNTDAHKDEILAQLPQLDEVLVLNLKTYQTLINDVQRAFALRGALVKVERTTDNHLHVFGYVADALVEANLIASVRAILAHELNNISWVNSETKGAVINSDLIIEPHFIYEKGIKQILSRLNTKYSLKSKYIYAPFDIAYIDKSQLESNPRFLALRSDLSKAINGPVSLLDSPSLSYKYSLLKQSLATGKGLVFGENDRITKRVTDTSLEANQSALLDYYQKALDAINPYQKRIYEQSLAQVVGVGQQVIDVPTQANNNVASPEANSYGSSITSQFLLSDIIKSLEKGKYHGFKEQKLDLLANQDTLAPLKEFTLPELKPPATEEATVESESEEVLPTEPLQFDVMGVTLKPLRFITMRDGAKIFEGGLLPGGYTVKLIAVSSLLLIDSKGKEVLYELK